MGRCGGLRARRLCSQLAWGILASWMLWALNLQISTRSDRPKTPAILGLMRLNFLSVKHVHVRAQFCQSQRNSSSVSTACTCDRNRPSLQGKRGVHPRPHNNICFVIDI